MRRAPLAAALVLAAGGAASAESEQALSFGIGYASFSAPGPKMNDGKPPASVSPDGGAAVAGTYEYAIGTDVVLRGEAAVGYFRGGEAKDQSPNSYAALADAGVALRFDVSNAVPYAFAGLGGVYATGGPIDSGFHPVLVVGGGVDWLTSPKRSYGGEIRLASFAGDITVVTINFRMSTRWGGLF